MVWHSVVLPGTHTVTVVYKVLTASLEGPASTTTDTTFDAAGTVVLPEEPEAGLESPPPHETVARLNTNARPPLSARLNLSISATHPGRHRPVGLAANRRGR